MSKREPQTILKTDERSYSPRATGPANARPNHLTWSALRLRRGGSRPHHFAKSVLSLRRSGRLLDECAPCGCAPGVDDARYDLRQTRPRVARGLRGRADGDIDLFTGREFVWQPQ
jgi:hypothetical protein